MTNHPEKSWKKVLEVVFHEELMNLKKWIAKNVATKERWSFIRGVTPWFCETKTFPVWQGNIMEAVHHHNRLDAAPPPPKAVVDVLICLTLQEQWDSYP